MILGALKDIPWINQKNKRLIWYTLKMLLMD